MARYINKYPTLTDYTEDTDARDALGKTVSLISSIGRVHYDKGNVGPVPPGPGPGPTPGYNYVFMNQFISPMPEPVHPYEELPNTYDNFENVVPASWDSDYQSDDLVSSTPGDTMLDSDTPVNFSSKGIQTGTPFGIVTWDSCPLEAGPIYAATEGSLSNGATIELWYKLDFSVNEETNVWLASIKPNNSHGGGYPTLLVAMEMENPSEYSPSRKYSSYIRLSTSSDRFNYTEEVPTNWGDGEWHHYALTYDASNQVVHFFIDGHKVKTISDKTSLIQELFAYATNLEFAQSDGYTLPHGRFAQIAVCDECKWTEDFTVPTVAY